ncbi:PREDICTED: bone morphogenetic protein receptor type-1B-like [Amphimedon queenslandica]|uniref:receptor protein serine/threonine kinase n=1 Tax=Amphimedon queenslandica TaxID=400682 RepID=A0A1X7VC25_AMPQE|nr:PREDICTED: bone morphogenetic protein receptor type-1B-like [Amphimedon queenslandica]|eukprot:XP_003384911.3 PREDICTED: bone morphogenetic protein receptor type-1B-like [Amphimedon queenslandica]
MDKFLMAMVDRAVSLLVFLFICQSVNGQNDHCQATSCINNCFYPPSCVVTPLSKYSYNYVCQASSQCQSSSVPSGSSYGYFCFVSLNIMKGNIVTFISTRLTYPSNSCLTGFQSCSPNIVMEVSSFDVTNSVRCSCFEENCQSMINVTLFIDPPDEAENAPSSFHVTDQITSSIEPSLSMIPSTVPAPSNTLRSHSFDESTGTIRSVTGFTTSLTSIEHSSSRIISSIPQSTNSLTSVSTRSSTESVLVPSSTVTSTAAVTIGLASGISILALMIALIAVVMMLILAYSWRKHSPKFHRCSHQIQFSSETSTIIELDEEPGLPPFQLIQSIGNGRFGSVWKALYEKETVAVRVFSQRHRTSWQNERDIHLLNSTPHENILKFISSESRGRGPSSEYFIITEYLPLGSLHQFLRHNTLSWEQAWNIMYSITSGITHLHSSSYYSNGLLADKFSIAHRDIKPSNILVKSPSGQCVVADFGQAFVLDPAADDRKLAVSGQVGTYRYMSPEALDARVNLRDSESFKQIDVYAMSLVLWEVCMRYQSNDVPVPPYQSPFFDMVGEKPTLDQMKEIVVINKQRPLLPEKWNNDKNLKRIIKLIVEGWDEDPEARLTAANIKIQLESLVGMRPKPPPSSTSQPDGRNNFLSPILESSESSCKKYRLSSSFSESSGNAVIFSNPSSKLSGRFSVDHTNNASSHRTILNDLRRYRDGIGLSNNISTTTTDSTQPNGAYTGGGSRDEVSSSESQDEVNVVDVTTGQPKSH